MRVMNARFSGTCRGCGLEITPGVSIAYGGRGRTYHANCQPSRNHRADQEYYAGLNDGHRYSQNRKLYGESLANQWAMDEELAAYNRGDDY